MYIIPIFFIVAGLLLLGCSSENEDEEWIKPRQCFALLPPCVPNNEITCNSSEDIERSTLTLEEHGCLFKKSACLENEIEGSANEKNMKCEIEWD